MRPANQVSKQVYLSGCAPREVIRHPKKRPPATPTTSLDREATLALIDRQLEGQLPRGFEWIMRARPPGDPVVRFLVPAALCRHENSRRQLSATATPQQRAAAVGVAKRERHDLYQLLYSQWLLYSTHPTIPLPGLPHIRAIKFSGTEPDPEAGWSKTLIDLLTVPRLKAGKRERVEGLSIIRGDKGSQARRWVWWEPWPRERAPVVLLEVYTGDPWELPGGEERCGALEQIGGKERRKR